jgi:hypothetical protein
MCGHAAVSMRVVSLPFWPFKNSRFANVTLQLGEPRKTTPKLLGVWINRICLGRLIGSGVVGTNRVGLFARLP